MKRAGGDESRGGIQCDLRFTQLVDAEDGTCFAVQNLQCDPFWSIPLYWGNAIGT